MEILLPNNQSVLFDDKDYEVVKNYKWHIQKGYASAEIGSRKLGTRKHLLMHRLIIQPMEKEMVDHKNKNRLDNRRENLRICNKSENGMNRSKQSNNRSGYEVEGYYHYQ